jgi:hypothetical protein
MVVVYSLDGVNFVELNSGDFKRFAAAAPTSGTLIANLPPSLANKQFYIGFRWSNDTNAGGPVSVSIDNVLLKGTSIQIENDLNHNGREMVKAGQEVYFYSVQDRQILGKINNVSGKDYGCSNMYVEKTGSGAFNLYQGRDGLQKVSDKIVRFEPATIIKGSNTMTLYFTEAQLLGLEQASGYSRTAFSIYHVNAAAYTLSSTQNTTKIATTYTAIAGVGGYYSFTFNDKPIGSYALGVTVSLLGAPTIANSDSANDKTAMPSADKTSIGNIYPNPGSGTAYLPVTAAKHDIYRIEFVNPLGQVMYTQRVPVQQGVNNIFLNTGKLSAGNYRIRITNQEAALLSAQQYLKQ